MMIIKDIQDINTGKTRTDGRYPQRIGCMVELPGLTQVGQCAYLFYLTDNQGYEKDGVLRTSIVTSINWEGEELTIETLNSRYILMKDSK